MIYITALELKTKLDNNDKLAIVDIRESYELDICKIESIHIPMSDIQNRCDELPKEDELIVLCRSGKRAIAVANILTTEHGFANVKILEGGILAWIAQVDNQLEAY